MNELDGQSPDRRGTRVETADRTIGRLVPWVLTVVGGIVALGVAARILLAPQWDWNAARLMFSFALIRGFDIYPIDGSEPAVGCIYGPVFPVAYLPATVVDSPTLAVLIGTSLAAGLVIAPAFALLWSCARADRFRWIGLVALVGTCLTAEPLRYSTFSIHADAPVLALLTGATGLWLQASSRQRTPLAAAALVALAVWCKQVVAPAALAFPLWSLLVSGRRASVRGLASLGVAGAVVSAVAVATFGFPDLMFNLVTLPGATPWYGSGTRLQRLAPVLVDFTVLMWPWLVTVVALTALHLRAPDATRPTWRQWLGHRSWLLLALVGVLLAPTSIFAKVRMGGSVNSWTPSLYFLVLACLCAVLDLGRAPGRRGGISGAARFSRLLLMIYAVGLGVHVARGPDLRDWRRPEARHPFSNPQQQAHDFLLAHPGSTYFPWNPLAHLLAESQLVHHADGVIIRDLAGVPLSQAEFDAGVGRTFVFVAAAPGRRNERVQARYLPQFSERVALPGLPLWTVYQVPSVPGLR